MSVKKKIVFLLLVSFTSIGRKIKCNVINYKHFPLHACKGNY